ncbi:acyl-CoA thioesterase [Mycobacterium sp.]|uniref:acyl-CoA thioesterase n=1 Tax=Mycobacterium sp. TaxID=1785 RepID=UPI001225E80B|nr:acyl-CoA thioesterase [Mycobacterium sp.]TAM64475.1 MAG: acyl-CoA thioesterase [Mycobacterium sp.]
MNAERDEDAQLFHTSPRPDPLRCRQASYPIVVPVEARYADMDVNGHLNNLALESLHENARATMNSRAAPGIYRRGRRSLRLVAAQNVVHFLAEAHWPATIHAGVGVGRLGNTSYVASSALFVDGACLSVCDTVLVAVADDGRPISIPEDMRTALSALTLGRRE